MCTANQTKETRARIYWVAPRLATEVHAGPLGFTKTVYFHVWATGPDEAKHLVQAHMASQGVRIERFTQQTSPAQNQELRTYCFPEHIIGLPEEILLEHLEPGLIREMVLRAHGARGRQLRKGLAALAEATA